MQPDQSSTTLNPATNAGSSPGTPPLVAPVRLFDLLVAPLGEQKSRVAGLAVALVLLSLAQGLFLFLVGPFLKTFFSDTGSSIILADILPHGLSRWASVLPSTPVPKSLLTSAVPALIILAGVLKAGATYLYQLHQEGLALWVAKRYRDRLFSAMLRLPYAEIRRRGAGEWMSLVMNDVILLQDRYSDIMTTIVRDGVLVIACFAAMLVIHWPTALILLAIAPVGALLLGRAAKRIAWFAEAFQRELARLAASVLDMRARFDFFRSQKGEATERARFAALNTNYYRVIRQSILIRSALGPSLELFGFALFAGFVWAISAGWLGPNAAPGQGGTRAASEVVIQFFAALGFLLRPLRNVGEQLTKFQETFGALASSLATFDSLERIARETPDAIQPALSQDAPRIPWDGLTINRVAAGFLGKVVFSGESLVIPSGKTIAIVGPSGSGKSTFVKTLAGLVRPESWDASLTWNQISACGTLVSQDPFLFDDLLRENLLYGLDTAHQPSAEEIDAALTTVNVLDEVNALPEKLLTRVRAIGSNFSGGQLQRLVIARALLRQKSLWLLDEATSAVDARSEKDITLRLTRAAREHGKSLIMVTHRLRWLGAFDAVWLIENGRVTCAGHHDELMRDPVHGPRYRRFCNSPIGRKDAP